MIQKTKIKMIRKGSDTIISADKVSYDAGVELRFIATSDTAEINDERTELKITGTEIIIFTIAGHYVGGVPDDATWTISNQLSGQKAGNVKLGVDGNVALAGSDWLSDGSHIDISGKIIFTPSLTQFDPLTIEVEGIPY